MDWDWRQLPLEQLDEETFEGLRKAVHAEASRRESARGSQSWDRCCKLAGQVGVGEVVYFQRAAGGDYVWGREVSAVTPLQNENIRFEFADNLEPVLRYRRDVVIVQKRPDE